MKNHFGKTRLLWVIVLLTTAAALICLAFFPDLAFLREIPIWKLLLGVVLLFWFLSKLLFGDSLAERFNVFIPAGILFLLFEKNIAAWANLENPDIADNWLIIAIVVLLTAAEQTVFHGLSKCSNTMGDSENPTEGNSFHSKMAESDVYFDVRKHTKFFVKNRLGELNVYFQNTDEKSETEPIILNVKNKLGETVIHVPDHWQVVNEIKNSLGDVTVRQNPAAFSRIIYVRGTNSLGETDIR